MSAINRLSAVAVRNAKPGKYADGAGVWLHKRDEDGGRWFLRYVIGGKRREMGLGSTVSVSLKAALIEAAK